MNYISTRGKSAPLSFEEAMLAGLASDGGLYVPETYPQLSASDIAAFRGASYQDIAAAVLAPFVDAPTREKLAGFINEAYASFTHAAIAPLTPLTAQHYLLELYHGPTLAFKDIAMQLLARLMDDALIRRARRATIIGATSGDTGGAAISAFKGRDAVDVFILYPHGRVSDVQRRQMTTATEANVHVVAIDGTFDDCQALIKAMFADESFREDYALSAVNSINWARVMAQIVYYFTSYAALDAEKIAFSVPTGNFGDIFAGFVAARMGLPVAQLMIATNVNDILARTLASGRYETAAVTATHSPSMDIQISSNFERLLFELSQRDGAYVCELMSALEQSGAFDVAAEPLAAMRALFTATRIGEAQTLAIMRDVQAKHGIILDPHSAVGVGAAQSMVLPPAIPIVSLATAHPAKFPQSVEAALGAPPATPPAVRALADAPERITQLPNDVSAVRDFVKQNSAAVK